MNNWPSIIQNWLYPPTCLLCGDPGTRNMDLCLPCLSALPRNRPACPRCGLGLPSSSPQGRPCGRCLSHPPAFTAALAPFRYEEPIRHLIHALKFRDRVASARLLGELLADEWDPENGEKPQCLIPVPLHPGRYRMRGYNQSLEIARVVSRRLDIPLRLHGCERIRPTPPQSELAATVRRRNVRGAFRVVEPVNSKHVAILDDIVTTGATVSELAKALRKAGVERVDVWAVARA